MWVCEVLDPSPTKPGGKSPVYLNFNIYPEPVHFWPLSLFPPRSKCHWWEWGQLNKVSSFTCLSRLINHWFCRSYRWEMQYFPLALLLVPPLEIQKDRQSRVGKGLLNWVVDGPCHGSHCPRSRVSPCAGEQRSWPSSSYSVSMWHTSFWNLHCSTVVWTYLTGNYQPDLINTSTVWWNSWKTGCASAQFRSWWWS